MSLMLDFYGLREHPFGMSPNPRFLYPAVQHREALASLILAIENEAGFAALIAEPGVGKTTLLLEVRLLYRERASTAFIFSAQCSGQELLSHIAMELQIPGGDTEHDPVQLHRKFRAFVADDTRTKPLVIIIDEAQNLEDSALETLRLLSNFEAADHKLTHFILAGQPQLGKRLRSHKHAQLLQRITTFPRLERLSPSQVEECIRYRLQIAGYQGPPLFSDEAMTMIGPASRGIPRELNRICMNAIQLGYILRLKEIGVEVVENVLQELSLCCDDPPTDSTGPSETEPSFTATGPTTSDARSELELADQVIEKYLSNLNPSCDPRTIASTGPYETGPKYNGFGSEATNAPIELDLANQVLEAYQSTPRCDSGAEASTGRHEIIPLFAGVEPQAAKAPCELNLGDQVIEAYLSGLDPSRDSRTESSTRRCKTEPKSSGVEPKPSKIPVDPRVAEIFAPKASKRTGSQRVSSTPATPEIFDAPKKTTGCCPSR